MGKIIWTRHAEERQKQWELKIGISREEAERALENPREVVAGEGGLMIAQSPRGRGLLRIVFKASQESQAIVTIYWTSKMEKYRRDS